MNELHSRPRIIPADAGSTLQEKRSGAEFRDHPRGCGEHTASPVDICWPEGSSPRMRGAHHQDGSAGDPSRIIPADAGSTSPTIRPLRRRRDHPRGCGEHSIQFQALPMACGSSPRMRGAPTVCLQTGYDPRIIPADAGSTAPRRRPCPAGPDHPRGCGEHQSVMRGDLMIEGSSPRMRGAHIEDGSPGLVARIIPADAGSTAPYPRPRLVDPDHPRGCGEHCCQGLPPRRD